MVQSNSRGKKTLGADPQFIRNPDGSIEILSVSIVPGELVPSAQRFSDDGMLKYIHELEQMPLHKRRRLMYGEFDKRTDSNSD